MFEKLGRSLDNFIQGVSGDMSMTRIETQTDTVSVAYPESTPVRLKLNMGVGNLILKPGGEMLIDGTATYNVKEWEPQIQTENGTVLIKQGSGWHVVGGWGNVTHIWDFALGTERPFELLVDKGAGDNSLDLGGVPLTSASIQVGAGESNIRFSTPNPASADRFSVKTGAGETKIHELLNANARTISVESGAGTLTLNLTGTTLTQDTRLRANVGAGEVVINVKRGIPTYISLTKGIGDSRAIGKLNSVGRGCYQTPDFDSTSDPKLTIEANAGVGSITVRILDEVVEV